MYLSTRFFRKRAWRTLAHGSGSGLSRPIPRASPSLDRSPIDLGTCSSSIASATEATIHAPSISPHPTTSPTCSSPPAPRGLPRGFDSHRNVLHNIRRYTNALAISADDRLTLLQSCVFSGSVSSLFGALLNGATIFPFDFAGEGPVELGRLLQRERLTMYHSVPSIFRSFLARTIHFPDVRVIRLEGDRASSLDAVL
jgi:hypothetical protein